jgi:hypothetical protein
MDASIDFELMTTSLTLTMGMKLFFFIFAAITIHLLLRWMDGRSSGGFNKWREAAMESNSPMLMSVLGVYYCIRFSVLYVWAALLFSS